MVEADAGDGEVRQDLLDVIIANPEDPGRVTDLMLGGGSEFATVYNISYNSYNLPPEDTTAMWGTLQECGTYRSW